MGKKNHPQQRSNQNSSAPQHHLTRESGRIRQRDEERQGQNQNQHHHHRFNQIQQQQQQQQQLTPEERYANNVNLLVLNLNSNPEQIYRETIGKMLHSMTTPYHQKFHVPPKTTDETAAEGEEKQEGDADEKKDGNDKKQQQNKNNKKNKNKQKQQQQTTNDHNNNSHILSVEKASFFPEDQQTATMLIHFPDKFSAKKLAQKLNQGQLFSSAASSSSGEQNNSSNAASTPSGSLHASVVPTVTLKPRYEPCALRITELLSPAQMNYDSTSSFTLSQLQQYLSSNPGFLSVSKVARVEAEKEEEQQQQQENSNNKKKKNQQQQQEKNNNSSSNNNSKRCFIATYADSGAALQARALMSGRAFHGVHLLLELIEEVENERVVPLV